jgi:hydrogenase maturation protease
MNHAVKTLIVGLGSAHGDDQAGWLVAENLQRSCGELSDVTVRTALVPLDVLDWLEGIDVLHLCDACESASCETPLLKLRWENGQFINADSPIDHPHQISTAPFRSRGSHDFSVPEMLQLAAQLGTLPKRVVLWAISGLRFQPGDAMSEQTHQTAIQSTEEIFRDVTVRAFEIESQQT